MVITCQAESRPLTESSRLAPDERQEEAQQRRFRHHRRFCGSFSQVRATRFLANQTCIRRFADHHKSRDTITAQIVTGVSKEKRLTVELISLGILETGPRVNYLAQ